MYKILVADDAEVLRMLVVDTLEDEDEYIIEEATDGKEAYEKASAASYDLLIIDNMMPEYNGVEVVSMLRKDGRLENMKTLMITAKSQDKDIEEARKAGVTEFVSKPFSPALLITIVEELLDA
ncbi:response regulator [Marinococcus sp. PL1-022]|uniref:response regulator n=1 Tax=Marinococcus sp. PL1-022 TaxID=3095363 RepID=UPI0029C13B05|nr:response regulator [Marinococcus sp. PL1-022]MDX6153636.1 response regulator [Marinococcus sp. PL1-022]